VKARAALLILLALAAPRLRADDGWDDHWVLRGVAVGLREPSAAVPVFNPITHAYVGQVPLAQNDWDSAFQASLRDYGGWEPGLGLRLEWNLLATAGTDSAGLSPTAQPLGRSAALERRVFGDAQHQDSVELDQLNVRWQGPQLSVVAGRQSVNLGQNFYFSPLDLFQPFKPQDNYRDFRAGVDALRATWSPGHFTQVEALAVAGYAPQQEGGNATQSALWLDGPQGQGSLLLRAESGADAWQATALGGRFAGLSVGGGSLQLEGLGSSWILEGLAGQALDPLPGLTQGQGQATLGWTRQWNRWLDTRVEASESAAWSAARAGDSTLLRRMAAASADIQADPLWTLDPALLWYGDPGQCVALLDAGWSASENGSLHIILSLPVLFYSSEQPHSLPTQTQAQPSGLSLDYRLVL
jgi:hypothetical protein